MARVAHMRGRELVAGRPAAAISTMVAGAGVAALSLAVYLLTLARDLYSLDSPELTAAAQKLGIAHAPGYPLYTLTGWTFSHAFPIGNVAFRFNLLSALFGVAAVVLAFILASRLTSRPVVAAAGALALGFSYYFWADSLTAEVYTLDAALFAGILLASYEWRERRTLPLAAGAGLLLGLSLATRTTTALYLPAIALFAWSAGERSPRAYGAAAGGLVAGLLFYLYLPLRSASGVTFGPGDYTLAGDLRVFDLASWGGFWHHVTAADFQRDVLAYGPLGALRETGVFGARLAGSFLVVGVPLGIAGAVRMWRADRALFLLLVGTAGPLALFFINYGALDKEFMFLPAYVVWALWIVAGIDWSLEALASRDSAWGDGSVAVAALLLPALMLVVNLPLVSLRGEDRVRTESEAFLGQVREGAIVYGPFLDVAPFQYLQAVEGQRLDVTLVNSWTVDDGFLVELADANVGGKPLYVTEREPALLGRYELVPVGDGYEVRPRAD